MNSEININGSITTNDSTAQNDGMQQQLPPASTSGAGTEERRVQDEATQSNPLNDGAEQQPQPANASEAGAETQPVQNEAIQSAAQEERDPPKRKVRYYDINNPVEIPHTRFPNKGSGLFLPMTIANLKYLLASYRIEVGFDVYRRKHFIKVPGLNCPAETADNATHAHIVSLINLHHMHTGPLHEYLAAIASEAPYNGPASWILSRPWDGEDRLAAFYATLKTPDFFPVDLKETLMFRWLISLVAAAVKDKGFHSRGVLVLQGRQSIGKTTWFVRLVSDLLIQEGYIKTGHHLDPGNKDSLVAAIAHWLVELGELDSSFKKDIARLKGFLTDTADKIRLPYGKRELEFPRRTVFCATVNEDTYLVDPTGNTRFWTIPVLEIDNEHTIDMQQLFAQAFDAFQREVPWWLSQDEERQLEESNRQFRAVSTVRDAIFEGFNFDLPKEKWSRVTRTQLLKEIGFDNPTNAQSKEAASTLRELESKIGPPRKSKGIERYTVPIDKDAGYNPLGRPDEDSEDDPPPSPLPLKNSADSSK